MTDDRSTLPSGKAVVYETRDIFDLLARTQYNQVLVDDAGRPVPNIIKGYADTWRRVLEYDKNRLAAPPGARPATGAELKLDLMARKDASALFGNLLEGILSNIEQTSLIVNPLVEPMR